MKKLLNRTLSTFVIYSLIVLAASIPAYYYLVDSIWLAELDEHNEIIADRTKNELNNLKLNEVALSQSIVLWNKIQPGTNLEAVKDERISLDSTYTVFRQNPYKKEKSIDRFRGLVTLIHINNKLYYLTVETNVEETEETVAAIAFITLLFFLILVIGFMLLNRRLSVKLWKPFRSTLAKLKTFNLNQQTLITFEKSNTLEFEELNIALGKLLEHNLSVYKTQKEFTENASHELQTPLAIIKNKLDLLLQKEAISDRQYQIIEEINNALTRVTRINKNLLLLAKIENRQFDDNETVNIGELTLQCIANFKEHSDNKSIIVKTEIDPYITIKGNKILIEILLNNLLLNAIRHNQQGGEINVLLVKNQFSISNSGTTSLNTSTIFKRFAKTSDENSGNGLGLSIIEQICNFQLWKVAYHFKNYTHTFNIHF